MLATEVTTAAATIPNACQECRVRLSGICGVLTPDELSRLAHQSRHTRYEPGDAITVETDVSTGYATIVEGVIKLSRVLRDGRQQLVGLQFSSDLLGRLYAHENALTAEAASEVELCRMPKLALETLVADSPDLKQRLLNQSLQDLDDAREWMVTLGRKSASERVVSLLLLFANRAAVANGQTTGPVTFDLPLIRSDMADFLGLTIETVSRQISKLRNEGIILVSSHRHVVVPSMDRLRRRAG